MNVMMASVYLIRCVLAAQTRIVISALLKMFAVTVLGALLPLKVNASLVMSMDVMSATKIMSAILALKALPALVKDFARQNAQSQTVQSARQPKHVKNVIVDFYQLIS